MNNVVKPVAAEEKQEPFVTFNGKEYPIASLSQETKDNLQALRFAETEMQRFAMQRAMAETARNAYRNAVIAALPKDMH